eukprot:XP_025008704.1 ferric-chelate reductase 1 isoform X4 [Gallus gallus]
MGQDSSCKIRAPVTTPGSRRQERNPVDRKPHLTDPCWSSDAGCAAEASAVGGCRPSPPPEERPRRRAELADGVAWPCFCCLDVYLLPCICGWISKWEIQLSGPDFEGFFIQARDADDLDSPAVGSFVLVDRRHSQLLTCGRTMNSAVSHTSKAKKKVVKVYWIAPGVAPKRVRFLATVVKKYKTFWVKIPGPDVSQPNVPFSTTPLYTTSEAVSTSHSVSYLTKPFNASGCGNTKFCLRNPSNCDPESASCFFLSFRQEKRSVVIEMSGASEGYLAFALSYDQWMGDDDAYLCINKDHHVSVSTAYLKGRSPPVLDSKNALEDVSWRLADGVLQCSFRRNISLPTYKGRFNMNASYYIFLADGEASEGGPIYKHHRQPLITNGMYNVTGIPQDIGGSRSPRLIKAHGALMFVAWISTVSIGVVVARFFKPVWSHSFLFGKEIWFQVHRMLMLTTIMLTSFSFVLPFIYRGGWSKEAIV